MTSATLTVRPCLRLIRGGARPESCSWCDSGFARRDSFHIVYGQDMGVPCARVPRAAKKVQLTLVAGARR